MPVPAAQLLCNELVIAAKKHQLHFFTDTKMLPIRSFQCRARQHSAFTPGDTTLNLLAQPFQPWPSIFVRQRMTAVHLLDICCRMKFVSFKKMPAQFSREQLAHCGFASTRDSIDDHDHGKSICLRLPIFSTTNAIRTKSV